MSSIKKTEEGATHAALRLDGSRVAEFVNRAVLDMDRDEQRLRERIRRLVKSGKDEEALRLLREWDEQPAGDVLRLTDTQ